MGIRAYDVVQQVRTRGSNEAMNVRSLNKEDLSSVNILCDPGWFFTYILHTYIIISYIKCNYTVTRKHLEEFLLRFKGFQNANLGNITDKSCK